MIGFGAGEPDFPTPEHIVAAAEKACRDPKMHHYTPTAGLPELRQAIAEKTKRDSGYAIEASQVLVTNGGKQAVYEAFATLLDPGDEVIVPAPYWTTYPESIHLAGGVTVPVLTGAAAGYKVTIEQLDAARTARTKVLLVVSPSNPTGAVYTPEETHGHRPLGRRRRDLDHHGRDLRAPRLWRRPVQLRAGAAAGASPTAASSSTGSPRPTR